MHRAKWFTWEGNSLLQVWIDGWIWIVPRLEQCEGLVWHVHEELGHFVSNAHIVCSKHNIGGEGCNYKFRSLFLSVWCVTKFMHHSMNLHFNYSLCQLWG
jgi:hypothetical protein